MFNKNERIMEPKNTFSKLQKEKLIKIVTQYESTSRTCSGEASFEFNHLEKKGFEY